MNDFECQLVTSRKFRAVVLFPVERANNATEENYHLPVIVR